jgi:hypothetical protein
MTAVMKMTVLLKTLFGRIQTKKLRGLSLQANYTDQVTAACRQT